MKPSVDCPICRSVARRVGEFLLPPGFLELDCPICGTYRIEYPEFLDEIPLRERGRLHGALHAFGFEHKGLPFPAVLTRASWKTIVDTSGAPVDHADRVDSLLRYAAALAPEYGTSTPEQTIVWWKPRAFTLSAIELCAMFADHLDWLVPFPTPQVDKVLGFGVKVTRAGWARLQTLRGTRSQSRSVFVANWAHPTLRVDVETAIVDAVHDVGLDAEVGNALAPATGLVDDAILAGIRRARLVVADLTGCRGGVYFEAGFARGLDIPTIFTCHAQMEGRFGNEDIHDVRGAPPATTLQRPWRDAIHFDLNHYPCIAWTDPTSLRRSVRDCIRAWGRAAPGFEGGGGA